MITTAVQEREHYLNASYGIKSWLLTKDHKRIGLLYLGTITLFFFLGGAFATLIRVELLTPQGGLVSSETYNKLFTMHGVTMVFFFLIPSIPAVFSNTELTICPGANSIEAVIIMQPIRSRNAGLNPVFSISPNETPEALRSVSGNCWPKIITP